MNRLIKSVLLVTRRNILRSRTAIHWMAGCCQSRAYLACQAAEIPVKSAQESVQARVAPVDTPKLNSSPAEGFLLSCVLEREMLQIATGQLDFEHRRERFPFDFFFPGGQVEKVSLLTCGPAIQVFLPCEWRLLITVSSLSQLLANAVAFYRNLPISFPLESFIERVPEASHSTKLMREWGLNAGLPVYSPYLFLYPMQVLLSVEGVIGT